MRPSITPLEIRKRTFQKALRGYDPVEVTQFLDALADDLEEMFRGYDEMERDTVRLRDEVGRHRESEGAMKEALVLAQKSAEGLRLQSEKEASRLIADADRHADRLVQQAMDRVVELEKRIRELRVERRNFHLKLQGTIDMYQQVLNFDKEEDDLDASVSVLRRKREGE